MTEPGDTSSSPPWPRGTPAPYNPYGPPPGGDATPPDEQNPYGPPAGGWVPAGGGGGGQGGGEGGGAWPGGPGGPGAPPAPRRGRGPFPGVGWFLLLVTIGFLINTIGSGVAIYSLAIAYGADIKEVLSGELLGAVPPAALFAVLLAASLVWPAVALVASRIVHLEWREAFRWHKSGLGAAALSLLLGAATVPVALTLEHAMSRMAPRGENMLMQMMAQDPGPLALALLGVTLVVAAPVGEELLFRGLSLRGMERRYGFWPAAWIVSVVFASIHLNLTGFPALFLVSLLLCWVTSRTGTLLPAILMHSAYNGVQFAMLAASDPSPESVKQALSSPAWPIPAWMVASSLALAALCLLGLAALARRPR